MHSYLYPTEPHWFDVELENWKNSGKRYFSFPFLWFKPTTLPKDESSEFWLYLYYSGSRTDDGNLQRVVQYRAKVVAHSYRVIEGDDIFTRRVDDPKVWFKCDVVEELRTTAGSYLKDSDFSHVNENQNLLSSIRNSIAPVKRNTSVITVQQTRYCLQD
jgi:predicted phosphatase